MNIRITRLHHLQITIPVGAEARAREFYGSVLGLEEIDKPDELRGRGGLWFALGDIQLHIGVEADQSLSKRHPAFEVERIEEVKSYLQEKGVEIREEIELPGMSRFSFFDPFGNRVELLELIGGVSSDD